MSHNPKNCFYYLFIIVIFKRYNPQLGFTKIIRFAALRTLHSVIHYNIHLPASKLQFRLSSHDLQRLARAETAEAHKRILETFARDLPISNRCVYVLYTSNYIDVHCLDPVVVL